MSSWSLMSSRLFSKVKPRVSSCLTSRMTRRKGLLVGAAAVMLTAGTIPILGGCQYVAPMIPAIVKACIDVLITLLDEPIATLPADYRLCGYHDWPADGVNQSGDVLKGGRTKYCVYCSEVPGEPVYLQLNCAGELYPLSIRRTLDGLNVAYQDHMEIVEFTCTERILTQVGFDVDSFQNKASAVFITPNERVMPDVSRYKSLSMSIDNRCAPKHGDFFVKEGSTVRLEGEIDEVAHYAMTIGLEQLEFDEGGIHWTILANANFSSIVIFKDAKFYESRFIFAPAE